VGGWNLDGKHKLPKKQPVSSIGCPRNGPMSQQLLPHWELLNGVVVHICNIDATVGATAMPIGLSNCPSSKPKEPHLVTSSPAEVNFRIQKLFMSDYRNLRGVFDRPSAPLTHPS